MNGQTLNTLKKLFPKKEYSPVFCCFIGAAVIVLLTISVHILVFTTIEKHGAVRDSPEWHRPLAALSVDTLYPLLIVSLVSIVKWVFRIPVHRLERRVSKFTYLCLGLITIPRVNVYVGLYAFLMVSLAADTAIYTIIGIRFLYELFKFYFIPCRYYQKAYDKVFHHSVMQEPQSQ